DAVALAAGDGEVTHLLALADDRFLLVAGHDARVRHHLAATLALQRRDLEVPVDVVAEDRERQRAAIGDRIGEVERVVEGDAALVVGVEHLAIGPLVAVDAARGDPAVEVVAAVDTEAGAEVAGERLVRDHDPGLDHHLVDRLVEGLDQALDLGHALRDVDREQGIGAAVEAQAAARGEKAAALAHATAGAAAAVAGLALFGEELDDVFGVAVADRDVLGDHLGPLFHGQPRVLLVLLELGDLRLRRHPDDVAVAPLVER